jgi:hypothetical protein
MITWNLTLSGQQIALLKMFAQRVEGKEFYMRGRESAFGVHPNTIPGTRTLCREGLVEHREVKDKRGYMDVQRSGHFITERGRFILGMIETDIDKFLSVENQVKTKRALKQAS